MSDSVDLERRRVLTGLTAAAIFSGTAGCLGDDDSAGDTEDASDGGDDSTDEDTNGGGDENQDANGDDEDTNGDGASNGSGDATDSSGEVTANVSLAVRESQSNVDRFDSLATTFEAIELLSTDGETVRLEETTTEVDLTELGPGGTVDLFQTAIPAGSYQELKLYLPIQEASLADGGNPEFDRTVPASREIQTGDPIEVTAGDTVDLRVTVSLLRIAGDGPWTYSIGWGVS